MIKIVSLKMLSCYLLLVYLRHSCYRLSSAYKTESGLPFVSLHVIISLYLWSSNHKSTQTCLHHCLDGKEDGNLGY
jgi:hypothetical protein